MNKCINCEYYSEHKYDEDENHICLCDLKQEETKPEEYCEYFEEKEKEKELACQKD